MLQAPEDHIASIANAQFLERRSGGLVDTLILDDSYHFITMDRQRSILTDRVGVFAQALAAGRSLRLSFARRCHFTPHDRTGTQMRIIAGLAALADAEWCRCHPHAEASR